MASTPSNDSACSANAAGAEFPSPRPNSLGIGPSASVSRRSLLLLLALVLFHFSNPLGWGFSRVDVWFPPAGLALVLIAWFGARAAAWVALDGVLVAAQAWTLGWLHPLGAFFAAMNATVGAVLLLLAWQTYRRPDGGARDLADPRSAKRFLFLIPCVGVGLWALIHGAMVTATEQSLQPIYSECLAFWISRALGVMVLAPLLLAGLTPWLIRRKLLALDDESLQGQEPLGRLDSGERMGWGDGLEWLGLALAAGTLTFLAARTERPNAVGWELWGVPLLPIVWASLRQGLRGAIFVAAVSASAPLLLLSTAALTPLVQINLLGQCAVALLAATAVGWVRSNEECYRQLARHLPVVLYSARLRRPESKPTTSTSLDADITLVSAGCEPLLRCTPRDLLGEYDRWLERVHPDDREVLLAAIAQLGRQSKPVTCEYRLNTHDSTTLPAARWLRDTLAPCWDEGGSLIGWEGLVEAITEQRELADDLRRTTNMLNALVDNLPTGVYFVQGSLGQPLLVNARARQLLGQREDLAASLEHLSDVYRLHRPDGTPYPVEQLPVYRALRMGLTSMSSDIVVHRPDGRRTPLVTWAAPIRFPSSGIRGSSGARIGTDNEQTTAEGGSEAAVWVMEDISALHRSEAARLDSETRLRTILETMSEGVIVWDQNARILDCNDSAAALVGHAPETLRGLASSECDWCLLHEDGTPLSKNDYPVAEVLNFGRPVRNRVLAIVPHAADRTIEENRFKEMRWILVNSMPLGAGAAGNSRALGVVSTYIDITTTVRAQRLLRESEEKYRELVESLPLMVIQADERMNITYANSAVRTLTGYERVEIADPTEWSQLVDPDDLPQLRALAQSALKGLSARAEFRYRAKDGGTKVGLAFAAPRRRGDGVICGTTTLIADVTRERQLEQELLRTQRLELVGRLSSGIAHDFNNLLSVVLSLTELVTINLPVDHTAQQDLSHIKRATEQAANLAGQLLTFSKQRHVAARRLDLNPIAARTLDLLRATLPSRIELRIELADDALFVQADETQLQQVLMNLCLNARDALPDGGWLLVRTERISNEREWVRLSVRDNGIGLSEAIKAHLFDPFYSTKENGTGLGLAVVRQIVESQGGRVEAVVPEGRGARFDVWWPAADSE